MKTIFCCASAALDSLVAADAPSETLTLIRNDQPEYWSAGDGSLSTSGVPVDGWRHHPAQKGVKPARYLISPSSRLVHAAGVVGGMALHDYGSPRCCCAGGAR